MLSGEPHVATPYALRDTELVRFSSESFHALIDRYPQALKTLTRTLIQKSIVAPHASGQRRASTRYFTIVPTGPSAPATAFAQAFDEAALDVRADAVSRRAGAFHPRRHA